MYRVVSFKQAGSTGPGGGVTEVTLGQSILSAQIVGKHVKISE